MNWIYLVIVAQFIGAIVFMVDKYLIASKSVGRPAVYAFYIGMLSGVVVLLLPLGVVSWPEMSVILISLAVAASFIFSILFLYNSLQTADASDVAPVMGAIGAISTLLFSLLLLKTGLPSNFFVGFPLLILGTFLMSAFRFDKRAALFVILAGVMFGLSSVFVKMIFLRTDFFNGFFWSRIANVIGAAMLLLWPANRKAITANIQTSRPSTKLLVIGNKALAGIAFFLTMLAINLGDVATVNSLAGIQFVFLLILAFIFTYRLPKYFHEAVHQRHNRMKKIIASGLIIAGFLTLFY